MTTLRILLVDDHEVVRMGLRTLLEDVADVEVVAEAGSADEAIAACERYKPNIVVMDIRMPGNSGITACHTIVERWPETQVIMLTSYANDDLITDAIRAGAVGYVLKQGGTGDLMRALEAVRQGAALLDPAVTRRVLAMMRRQIDQAPDPFAELTDREISVLRLLAEGKSNAQIAQALTLSDKTVRNHISLILDKLDVSNRVEAATFAVQHDVRNYRRDEHGG
jgi:two-component system, NarL family, response regulator DevR